MKKIACLVLIVSICFGSMMSYRAHSSVLMQYSSFGGVASVSTWSGASIMMLVNYIAQLASSGIGAEHNRTVNIVVPPLPFPNPFSLTRVMDSKFGQTGSVIGFTSDKAISGDITVMIYDMFGNRVMQRVYGEGAMRVRETRADDKGNKFTQLTVNKSMLEYDAPSGVYLYVVQAEGKRIGKGKMLIVP